MSTAVNDAIAAAKANAATAAAAAAANPQLPAVQPQAPGAVAQYANAPMPSRMTLDDVDNAGIAADEFLKVKEHGLLIGAKPGLIEKIRVSMILTSCQVCQTVKYGDPAVYEKSIDGLRTMKGGSWQDAQMRAKRSDPSTKTDPYVSVDFTARLVEDAKDMKGALVLEAGKVLGHSTSTTNLANFRDLKKTVEAQGLLAVPVLVDITAEPRSNKNGNKWGVLKFEFIGPELQ